MLSGFVLSWIYEAAIESGDMAFRRFMLLRLCRVYPLYFVTLLLVALLQFLLLETTGLFRICDDNGPTSFVLNVFLLQSVWAGHARSFNGPAWSISVEIFLYALFFAASLAPRRYRLVTNAGLVACGVTLACYEPACFVPFVNVAFGRGRCARADRIAASGL